MAQSDLPLLIAASLDTFRLVAPQNGDKVPKFVVVWTIATMKVEMCAPKFHYIKTQRQSCSAINCLSSGVNILAGGTTSPEILAQSDLPLLKAARFDTFCLVAPQPKEIELECGPMPNLMVALPNIGGALCSTPQSLADAHY